MSVTNRAIFLHAPDTDLRPLDASLQHVLRISIVAMVSHHDQTSDAMKGATLNTAPTELRLVFTEAAELAFTRVIVLSFLPVWQIVG